MQILEDEESEDQSEVSRMEEALAKWRTSSASRRQAVAEREVAGGGGSNADGRRQE